MMRRDDIELRARELYRSEEARVEKQVREMALQAAQHPYDGLYPNAPYRGALQTYPTTFSYGGPATTTNMHFREITVDIPAALTDPFERQLLAEEIIWDALDGMK